MYDLDRVCEVIFKFLIIPVIVLTMIFALVFLCFEACDITTCYSCKTTAKIVGTDYRYSIASGCFYKDGNNRWVKAISENSDGTRLEIS